MLEEEYYLNAITSYDLELNDKYYSDLNNVYQYYRKEALKINIINFILTLFAFVFVVLSSKLLVKVSCYLWGKLDKN